MLEIKDDGQLVVGHNENEALRPSLQEAVEAYPTQPITLFS
jgi:hypothetical protein